MRTLLPILFVIGCNTPTGETRGTWKASTKADSYATCAGSCGGRSPGMCYCDPACVSWGDCCPDYQPVCNGADLGHDGFVGGPSDLGGFGGPNDLSGPFGGPSDLGGPSAYDALPAATGRFTANLDVQRSFYVNGSSAASTSVAISVSCFTYGSAQVACGSWLASVGPDGAFVAAVQWEGNNVAWIGGKLLSSQVEVTSYSLTTQLVSYSFFSDSWSGSQLSPIVAP